MSHLRMSSLFKFVRNLFLSHYEHYRGTTESENQVIVRKELISFALWKIVIASNVVIVLFKTYSEKFPNAQD